MIDDIHGSGIISVMVISVRFTLRISLNLSLMNGDFCLFLGGGSGDRDLVPQFCRGLPFPL